MSEPTTFDYKRAFEAAEGTLRNHSAFTPAEFDAKFGKFKSFATRERSDDAYFNMLILIAFYSGFKASTVEKKTEVIHLNFPDYRTVAQYKAEDIERMMVDPDMISNRKKIPACIHNAKEFTRIIDEDGSFRKFLDWNLLGDDLGSLLILKEELQSRFKYLGGITVYHFMTDLGYDVLKPDRVIIRIFQRLGLIEHEYQLLRTIFEGRKFAEATNLPIRYIDIIFVKYGQQGKSDAFGLPSGICLEKNPKCGMCGLRSICKCTS